ncbi:cystatin-like [Pimephales promelas]|uniref:cystatin-like n=1 Tax=Pimephales promelas TaxID=90988 RepID=UPI001955D9AC|nr:cystatin-like [Pimephales promelas]
MYFKMIVSFLAVMLAVASAGLIGGPVDADMNDDGVQSALQFAKAQFNNHCFNDSFELQIRKVVKVQTQVVSGLKYIFTVKVARTPCRKDGVNDSVKTLCVVPAVADVTQCKIAVWSQPWLNSIIVVENTCI